MSAVLLEGNSVRWAASRQREPDAPLGHTLRAILASCPRHGMVPVRVTAALGPSVSQLKCLTALPPIADSRALAALVSENADRFFLRNGVPLTISGPLVEAPTRVWIAAFDAPVIAEVSATCHDLGLVLRLVVPTAMALRRTIRDRSIVWTDGDVQLDITYGAVVPVAMRRTQATGTAAPLPPLIAALLPLERSCPDALDAAGAALSQATDAVVARAASQARSAGLTRSALRRAGAACVCTLFTALASPGVATWIATRRDHSRAAAIAIQAQVAERSARELATTTGALRALSDFSASRQSMTLLLAEVTRGLPDSATLVAFQVDSSGLGSVVALAPHAAAVVDAVERMPGLALPQIIGPVTRERAAERDVERVTVQFRLLPPRIP